MYQRGSAGLNADIPPARAGAINSVPPCFGGRRRPIKKEKVGVVMNQYSFDNNTNSTIGIIGFGHLGHSLAVALVNNGFPKERLLISDKDVDTAYDKAMKNGLAECLSDVKDLAFRADAVIVAVRPQDVLSLSGLPFKPDALVISSMAGLPIDLLRRIFEADARRMMCSGPDTILEGRGIATLFPYDERVSNILGLMGMSVFEAAFEAELDSFTAGICIPAILLNIDIAREDVSRAMDEMEKKFRVYAALREWIMDVTPQDAATPKDAYLENVSTKGGICEAMTRSLRSGSSLSAAILRGIERGDEITVDIVKEAAAAFGA